MINSISTLGTTLSKEKQKSINGGFLTEYVANCSVWSTGFACLTGLPHCPTGFCSGGVCSPTTGG